MASSKSLIPLRSIKVIVWLAMVLLLSMAVSSCATNGDNSVGILPVEVMVDGSSQVVEARAGDTVESTLAAAGITLNTLDEVDPPGYTILTNQSQIRVTRIREEFFVEENPIPFISQTVKNESLPEGQVLLIQPGENGIQQITNRIVYEDNIETSRSVFKIETVKYPEPEITMVGVQIPFTPIAMKGAFAYLSAGNAWIIEGNSGNRRPVVTTGDLDGQIFSLSPNRQYLLFTRAAQEDLDTGNINSLWAIDITNPEARPFALRARNIIHFADWVPGQARTVMYSSVEPREAAPGWQANNDLYRVIFNSAEAVTQIDQIIDTNQGGDYGWWGTTYAWSPNGSQFAYARPDGVGIVDLESGELQPLMGISAYSTQANWAWVPPLGWSPDGRSLFTINYYTSADSATPSFNLTALLPEDQGHIPMIENTGMFAYPVPSPIDETGRYWLAYLQAIFPDRSDTSRYRLWLMDRDGSNRQMLFPEEGSLGVEPQLIRWEPITGEGSSMHMALIYQGNIFLIDPLTRNAMQITGDASISRIDWK